jgi:hypothetical protein
VSTEAVPQVEEYQAEYNSQAAADNEFDLRGLLHQILPGSELLIAVTGAGKR